MAALLLDGRALSKEMRTHVLARCTTLRAAGIVPRFAIVLVGNDESSLAYVRSLQKTASACTIDAELVQLPEDVGDHAVEQRLDMLARDDATHGIILQQPLPKHLSLRALVEAIPAHKDVDAATALNQGRLAFASGEYFVPATPAAVMALLEISPAWPMRGKNALVVGRSSVVGLPVALLLMQNDATVTIAHSRTADLAAIARRADIVVAAAGKPGMITGDMLAPHATVIDVGTSVVDGALVGDVAFESAKDVVAALTPVPGGVGPVTNVSLMHNVLVAAERSARHSADAS